MLYKPKPGSVDLWIFGGTNIEGTQGRPTVTPDQLRAKNAKPTGGGPVPRDTRTAAPLPPGVDTGPAPENPPPADPTTPPPPSPSLSVTASPTPSKSASPTPPPTPTPTPSATPSATTGSPAVAAPGPKVVDAAPAADAAHDVGSWVPAVVTGALGLLIGAAAVFAAKRRRRTE